LRSMGVEADDLCSHRSVLPGGAELIVRWAAAGDGVARYESCVGRGSVRVRLVVERMRTSGWAADAGAHPGRPSGADVCVDLPRDTQLLDAAWMLLSRERDGTPAGPSPPSDLC